MYEGKFHIFSLKLNRAKLDAICFSIKVPRHVSMQCQRIRGGCLLQFVVIDNKLSERNKQVIIVSQRQRIFFRTSVIALST